MIGIDVTVCNEKIRRIKLIARQMLENAKHEITEETRTRHDKLSAEITPLVQELAREVAASGENVNKFFEVNGLTEVLSRL